MFLKLSDLALLQMLAVVLGAGALQEEEEEERLSWSPRCLLCWRLTRLWDLEIGFLEAGG